jgi:hypothetical protein
VSHREADAAQELDAFGDFVDKLILLAVVLVEQKVQLVERRPADLPMMLLVQISQCDRVDQELIQVLDAVLAGLLGQGNRHPHDVPEGLDLVSLLVGQR